MTRDQIMKLAELSVNQAIDDILHVDPVRDIHREAVVTTAVLNYLSHNLYRHKDLI